MYDPGFPFKRGLGLRGISLKSCVAKVQHLCILYVFTYLFSKHVCFLSVFSFSVHSGVDPPRHPLYRPKHKAINDRRTQIANKGNKGNAKEANGQTSSVLPVPQGTWKAQSQQTKPIFRGIAGVLNNM